MLRPPPLEGIAGRGRSGSTSGSRSVERAASLRLAALSGASRSRPAPRDETAPVPYGFVTTMPKGVAPAGRDAGEDASSVRVPPSTLKIVTASIAASTT